MGVMRPGTHIRVTPVALVESRYLRHVKSVWHFMLFLYQQIIPLVECVYSHYSKPAILACVGPDESGCCFQEIGEAVFVVPIAPGNAVQQVLEHVCSRIPVALSLACQVWFLLIGDVHIIQCLGLMMHLGVPFAERPTEAGKYTRLFLPASMNP